MKDLLAVEDFLMEKVTVAVAPRRRFSIGSLVEEYLCLVFNGEDWSVGFVERGVLRDEARFNSPVTAGKFLILLLIEKREDFVFPYVDWTGYADLPEGVSTDKDGHG